MALDCISNWLTHWGLVLSKNNFILELLIRITTILGHICGHFVQPLIYQKNKTNKNLLKNNKWVDTMASAATEICHHLHIHPPYNKIEKNILNRDFPLYLSVAPHRVQYGRQPSCISQFHPRCRRHSLDDPDWVWCGWLPWLWRKCGADHHT